MENQRNSLLATLNELEIKLNAIPWKSPHERTQEKLKLLHKYNAVKDAAQVIVGDVANITGNTISAQHEAFNLPIN